MRKKRTISPKLFRLFEHPWIRWAFVLPAFLLHGVSVFMIVKWGVQEPLSNMIMNFAALSLAPLVLFSQNLGYMALNIAIALVPMPLFLFALALVVKSAELVQQDDPTMTLSGGMELLEFPLWATKLLLTYSWPVLVGAFVIRSIGIWVARPRPKRRAR